MGLEIFSAMKKKSIIGRPSAVSKRGPKRIENPKNTSKLVFHVLARKQKDSKLFFGKRCLDATLTLSQKKPMPQELPFRSQNVALVDDSMCIVVGPDECENPSAMSS